MLSWGRRYGLRQGKKLLLILIWCTLSGLFFHYFVVRAVVVTGESMVPTLQEGDIFIVETMTPRLRQYARGEIVIINDGQQDYAIKRIIGLPGEKVQVVDGTVLINNRPLTEPYLQPLNKRGGPRRTSFLGRNEYFVMGDNRAVSYDSRSYGPIVRQSIIGSVSRHALAIR